MVYIRSFVLVREDEEIKFNLTDEILGELYKDDIKEINQACPLIEEMRYFNQEDHYIREEDYFVNDIEDIIQPWLFLDPYMLDVTSINTPSPDIKNLKYPHTPNGWQWGKKRPKWYNKRFSNPKYIKWRFEVILKYNHRCQKCGVKNAEHCHHIQNYSSNPELRFEKDNGVLFCKNCHNEFHEIYGVKNNSKHQLNEFLGSW